MNHFLGLEEYCSADGLHLSQSRYIHNLLTRTNMLDCKPCSTPLTISSKFLLYDGVLSENPTVYHNIIGALQYLYHTRLDISFVVNKLSQFLANPLTTHWVFPIRVEYSSTKVTHS